MISSLRIYDRCRDSAHEQVYWVVLIFIFALGFFLARSHLILQDPDTYWHIATGRWIVEQGKLPPGDVFSFTVIGKIWIFYEWAAQVLMALANYVGAWLGVVVLSVLSAATSVAI